MAVELVIAKNDILGDTSFVAYFNILIFSEYDNMTALADITYLSTAVCLRIVKLYR